jgi:hypothetical protein
MRGEGDFTEEGAAGEMDVKMVIVCWIRVYKSRRTFDELWNVGCYVPSRGAF